MKHLTPFIIEFMNKYNYPEKAVSEFSRVLTRLDTEADFAGKFDALIGEYPVPDAACRLRDVLEKVTSLAEEKGENDCTLEFVFLLVLTEKLRAVYTERGLSDELFYETMDDLRCKLIECMECEEVPGTFVGGWFDGFFRLERFSYGRFEYEVAPYDLLFDYTTSCGIRLTKGSTAINFHIPSSGIPLTDEVRLASYKKAYEAYKHLFPDGKVIFRCSSWLLYPKHRDFLPANSNILRFMDDFELCCWEHDKADAPNGFSNGWRVFAKYSDGPVDQLPRDTSIRRAYADRLAAGLTGGSGYGVIVFDGEKIVR